MFNIGAGEFALIAVVALLVLGPKRLPELARGIGKFLREFRKQTDDVRNVVEREFYKMDEEIQAPQPPASGGSLPSQTNKASANRTPASTNAPVTPGTAQVPPAPLSPSGVEGAPAPVSPSGVEGPPPEQPTRPGVPDTVAAGELPVPEPMQSQVMAGLKPTEEKK